MRAMDIARGRERADAEQGGRETAGDAGEQIGLDLVIEPERTAVERIDLPWRAQRLARAERLARAKAREPGPPAARRGRGGPG